MKGCYGDQKGKQFRVWVDRVLSTPIGSNTWLVKFDKWELSGESVFFIKVVYHCIWFCGHLFFSSMLTLYPHLEKKEKRKQYYEHVQACIMFLNVCYMPLPKSHSVLFNVGSIGNDFPPLIALLILVGDERCCCVTTAKLNAQVRTFKS